MTVEEIVTERQKLATEVLDGSKAEMAKIGLTVDSLQIQSIDDMNSGYIDAMAAPHRAAIQRQAKIARPQANQAASRAEQEAQRKQAEYARQTAVVQAQYKAEVDQAQAESAQVGPLTQAQAQMGGMTVDGLEAFVPDLQVVRVPNATHWIVHERPQLVSAEIEAALAR